MLASKPMNRRSFLATSGLGLSAAALAACTGGTSASPSPAPSAGASPGASGGASAAPSAGPAESEFFMYNWSEYINPDNIKLFEERYDTVMSYEIYDSNEVLMARLDGGVSGYDVASPTAEYVPRMVEKGYIQKLDLSRIPNVQYINATFKDLWWDPTNEYQVPKDYGTTGILYRSDLLSKVPQTWQEFYDMAKGEASGKVVMVASAGDVFTFPLKLRGHSLNSVVKEELDEAREILLDIAPHVLALDSNDYGTKMQNEEAVMSLGWTGVLSTQMSEAVEAGVAGYVVPSEGSLFWLDTWVILAGAPHPNVSYLWMNFIHEPEVQGAETNYNLYGTPSDAAKQFVDPEILADPAIFPSEEAIAKLEGAEDVSAHPQRTDIWEEFRQAVGG
jgi:spermidine/putrescine transport system substrate-binding protein